MADLNYIAAGRINTTPLDLNGNLDKILKQCAQASFHRGSGWYLQYLLHHS